MGAGGCGEGAGRFRPGAPESDDTIRPPMNETARDVSAVGSVGAVPSRGGLLGPTVAFALYLTHAAAAAILLVAAFRIFSLTAGFTAPAAGAAVAVIAIAGARSRFRGDAVPAGAEPDGASGDGRGSLRARGDPVGRDFPRR